MVSDDVKPTAADEPVPKLPRGRGLKLSGPQLFRIFMTLFALVGVIVLAKPCADSVSNFVMGYSQGSGSNAAKLPKPDNVSPPPEDLTKYEQLKPNMTEEELKAAIERAKAKNAVDTGTAGSAATGSASAGSGSSGSGSSAP